MAVKTWQSRDCTVTLDEATGAVTLSSWVGGFMEHYQSPEDVPWKEDKPKFKSLEIIRAVVDIGAHSFSGCAGLAGTLTIPDSIRYIGDHAFQDCSGFTGELIIPSSMTEISSGAFKGCSGFTGMLKIPDNIKMILYEAFCGCSGFTGTLIIPSSITAISFYAFRGVSNVQKVINHAKTQDVYSYSFHDMNSSVLFYGYPENENFKIAVENRWRNIASLPSIVTMESKEGGELYPRTKGEAVYLDSGRTLEAALGGLSFWRGTQAEYNALSPKPDKTVYCIIGGSVIVT